MGRRDKDYQTYSLYWCVRSVFWVSLCINGVDSCCILLLFRNAEAKVQQSRVRCIYNLRVLDRLPLSYCSMTCHLEYQRRYDFHELPWRLPITLWCLDYAALPARYMLTRTNLLISERQLDCGRRSVCQTYCSFPRGVCEWSMQEGIYIHVYDIRPMHK